MIEPTDEMRDTLWRYLPTEVTDFCEPDDILPWIEALLAVVERDQPFAKAGPNEDACGKPSPDGMTCQRRARHDVCVSWGSGNGADAWSVDYDDLVGRIGKLEGAFEVASNSRATWKQRALDAGWTP